MGGQFDNDYDVHYFWRDYKDSTIIILLAEQNSH